ncbi:hypothetical protein CVS40_5061 [Lucilia cuprina]|nr:hypothetical protein CVS40_5061 [Lucilia cuprina]
MLCILILLKGGKELFNGQQLKYKPNTISNKIRSHDNWIFTQERPESYSAKYCQPSDSCINRKFFPQERTIGPSRAVTTTTSNKI